MGCGSSKAAVAPDFDGNATVSGASIRSTKPSSTTAESSSSSSQQRAHSPAASTRPGALRVTVTAATPTASPTTSHATTSVPHSASSSANAASAATATATAATAAATALAEDAGVTAAAVDRLLLDNNADLDRALAANLTSPAAAAVESEIRTLQTMFAQRARARRAASSRDHARLRAREAAAQARLDALRSDAGASASASAAAAIAAAEAEVAAAQRMQINLLTLDAHVDNDEDASLAALERSIRDMHITASDGLGLDAAAAGAGGAAAGGVSVAALSAAAAANAALALGAGAGAGMDADSVLLARRHHHALLAAPAGAGAGAAGGYRGLLARSARAAAGANGGGAGAGLGGGSAGSIPVTYAGGLGRADLDLIDGAVVVASPSNANSGALPGSGSGAAAGSAAGPSTGSLGGMRAGRRHTVAELNASNPAAFSAALAAGSAAAAAAAALAAAGGEGGEGGSAVAVAAGEDPQQPKRGRLLKRQTQTGGLFLPPGTDLALATAVNTGTPASATSASAQSNPFSASNMSAAVAASPNNSARGAAASAVTASAANDMPVLPVVGGPGAGAGNLHAFRRSSIAVDFISRPSILTPAMPVGNITAAAESNAQSAGASTGAGAGAGAGAGGAWPALVPASPGARTSGAFRIRRDSNSTNSNPSNPNAVSQSPRPVLAAPVAHAQAQSQSPRPGGIPSLSLSPALTTHVDPDLVNNLARRSRNSNNSNSSASPVPGRPQSGMLAVDLSANGGGSGRGSRSSNGKDAVLSPRRAQLSQSDSPPPEDDALAGLPVPNVNPSTTAHSSSSSGRDGLNAHTAGDHAHGHAAAADEDHGDAAPGEHEDKVPASLIRAPSSPMTPHRRAGSIGSNSASGSGNHAHNLSAVGLADARDAPSSPGREVYYTNGNGRGSQSPSRDRDHASPRAAPSPRSTPAATLLYAGRRGSTGGNTAAAEGGAGADEMLAVPKLQEVLNPISLRRMSHSTDFFTPMRAFIEANEENN